MRGLPRKSFKDTVWSGVVLRVKSGAISPYFNPVADDDNDDDNDCC
jgi:hypothetical protein